MKKTLTVFWIITLLTNHAFGADVFDQYFSDSKKKEVYLHDIKPSEEVASKAVGSKISYAIHWVSFDNCTKAAADELGASIQTMTQRFVEMSQDPSTARSIGEKVKVMNFKNDPASSVPKLSYEDKSKTLTLEGDYNRLEWQKAPPVADMIRSVLKLPSATKAPASSKSK